ncbi:MAG TPA: type IX secretion system membrane protein PorP/SprF [Bacteroidetes bacterium]|nr:type IX secretion system membrane protein PorP/SprF [Bacteroidota bacterium]
MKHLMKTGVLLMLLVPEVTAQQLSLYSQFMFNDYVLNPAVAGTKNYYQIRTDSRFQWVGILDGPQTVSVSVFGPHASKPMGFGGYIINDVTGPASRTGAYGTYAYNVMVNNDIRLSMGLSFGMLQSKIDGTKITLFDQDDNALQHAVYSSIVPDASVGLYMYGEKWYAGASAFQLFVNSLKMYDMKNGLNRLKIHFYLMGGYIFEAGDNFTIEPAMLIKKTTPVPVQVDLNAKITYLKKVWLGVSFRSSDAVALLVGYVHNDKYYLGYSYDIGINDIRKYNNGSHEIMMGVRFNNIKNR